MFKPASCHPERKARALGLCVTCYGARWARLHPQKVARDNRNRRARNQVKMNALKDNPCTDCGNTFPPECMDWDHVRGEKQFTIGHNLRIAWERQLEEIAKCELVCSNCHRIRTKKRSYQGEQGEVERIENDPILLGEIRRGLDETDPIRKNGNRRSNSGD